MNQKENEPIEGHLVSEERLGNDPMNQKPCCAEYREKYQFCPVHSPKPESAPSGWVGKSSSYVFNSETTTESESDLRVLIPNTKEARDRVYKALANPPESECVELDLFMSGDLQMDGDQMDEMRAYISANFVSKKRIREVIEGKIQSGYHASNVLVVLSDIKQDLLGKDQPL